MNKKFTCKELEEMSCNRLREIAKELGITGRWDMSKSILIMSIMDSQKAELLVEAEISVYEEQENDASASDATDDVVNTVENTVSEDSVRRVKSAAIGTLIAFKDIMGKARTGMIVQHRKDGVIAETEYGAKFLVYFDNVLWVRFGKRWPRWVYNMLKGIKVENNGDV